MFFHKHIYLLFLLQFTISAKSYPIRFTYKETNEIVFSSARESTPELSKVARNSNVWKARTIWRRTSRRYFRPKRSCPNDDTVSNIQPCITPFIICDSTPNKSGFERSGIVTSKISNTAPPALQEFTKLGDLPIFNHDEQTCYIASMTPNVARKIASQTCESDKKNCKINPLLPMTKLSYGIVDLVTQTTENGDSVFTIMAELSPYHRQNRDGISLDKLVETIVHQSIEGCKERLEDALPFTAMTLPCLHYLTVPEIETEWLSDSVVAFNVTPLSNGESSLEDVREKILRFVSDLAGRPELISIEVIDSYYYNYFYNR